jgi:secreted Zn-dependent insulinase-like peptidase
VSQNDGSANAYTAFENTNYHLSISENALEGALDIVARMLAEPHFHEEDV